MYDYRYADRVLTTYSVLRRSWAAINKMTEVEIAKVGLTPDQLGVLWICRDASRPMNLTEIARVLFRSKATISELLKRMEKEGLIERVHIREEPRSVRIKLTSEGEEACNRGAKSIKRPLTQLMSTLSDEQQEQLQNLVQGLLEKALELLQLEISPPPGFAPGESVPIKW